MDPNAFIQRSQMCLACSLLLTASEPAQIFHNTVVVIPQEQVHNGFRIGFGES